MRVLLLSQRSLLEANRCLEPRLLGLRILGDVLARATLYAPLLGALACGDLSHVILGTETRGGDGDSDDNGNGNGNGNGTTGRNGNDLDGSELRLDLGPTIPQEPTDGIPYIWIANSPLGQVSKINTDTMIEEGRFWTSEDGHGDPSRTSVSIKGDVVVANRKGGLVKIFGSSTNCPPGGLSSDGPNLVSAWPDKCVAWYLATDFDSQRAVAWTSGETDPDSRITTNEKVWLAGEQENETGVTVMLVDGDSGIVERETTFVLTIDQDDSPGAKFPYRAYGGAVDRDSNFWFTTFGNDAVIVRVGRTDLSVDQWPKEHFSYGFTIDGEGRPWSCGVVLGRFDPDEGQWITRTPDAVGISRIIGFDFGGCMADAEERIWVPVRLDVTNTRFGVASFDTETLDGISIYELPNHVHGISIDNAGRVWGVTGTWTGSGTTDGSQAFRLDPDTGEFDTFSGLTGAYTYSDMTGFALNQTWIPREG